MKNAEKKLLKHGMKVTCQINGLKITSAKVSISNCGNIHICQDEKDGDGVKERFGYKYSWNVGCDGDSDYAGVTDLKIGSRTIKDGLYKGDILVDSDGDEKLVLETLNSLIFLSEWGQFDSYGRGYLLAELIEDKVKLKDEKEEDVPEYTWDELKSKLGHEFTIKD